MTSNSFISVKLFLCSRTNGSIFFPNIHNRLWTDINHSVLRISRDCILFLIAFSATVLSPLILLLPLESVVTIETIKCNQCQVTSCFRQYVILKVLFQSGVSIKTLWQLHCFYFNSVCPMMTLNLHLNIHIPTVKLQECRSWFITSCHASFCIWKNIQRHFCKLPWAFSSVWSLIYKNFK